MTTIPRPLNFGARWLALVTTLLLAAISGCAELGYYAQSISGQLQVLNSARPFDQVIADPASSPALRQRIERIAQMREFASRELALPDNSTFRAYADLKRPFVVWNVFAAAEFSTHLQQWCFPIAGCVGYRGYFAEQDARSYARELTARGMETYVGGVPAYSTLGWFKDPVLNTFALGPEPEVARIIFHELAHQVVYVAGATVFNESYASTVEEAGMRLWLERFGDAAHKQAFETARRRRHEFLALLGRARSRLESVYAQPVDTAAKRAAKRAALALARADYQLLKQDWGGYAGYDAFFAGGLNNAQLGSVNAYSRWVPAFEQLLRQNGGDLRRFHAAVAQLAKLEMTKRETQLNRLASQAAGTP